MENGFKKAFNYDFKVILMVRCYVIYLTIFLLVKLTIRGEIS